MPHARFTSVIDAPYDHVLELLVDKVEYPRKYVGRILYGSVEERGDGYVLRQMYEPPPVDLTIREKIYQHEVPGGQEFVYEHLAGTDYTGTFRNVLTHLAGHEDQVALEYVMDWEPVPGTADKITDGEAEGIVSRGVLHLKTLAERHVDVPAQIRAFYAAIDRSDPPGLAPVLTADCRFRFGNHVEVVGRDNIVAVHHVVLAPFASLRHEFEDVQRVAERAYVEAWVHYAMPDGGRYLLPFLTVFDFEDDLIASVKVFGDASPTRYGWD